MRHALFQRNIVWESVFRGDLFSQSIRVPWLWINAAGQLLEFQAIMPKVLFQRCHIHGMEITHSH